MPKHLRLQLSTQCNPVFCNSFRILYMYKPSKNTWTTLLVLINFNERNISFQLSRLALIINSPTP